MNAIWIHLSSYAYAALVVFCQSGKRANSTNELETLKSVCLGICDSKCPRRRVLMEVGYTVNRILQIHSEIPDDECREYDPCSEGWQAPLIDKQTRKVSCYRDTAGKFSWEKSRSRCKLAGGDLVSIDTTEEQEHITYSFPGKGDYILWTGGWYDYLKREWLWAANGSNVRYYNWGPAFGDSGWMIGDRIIMAIYNRRWETAWEYLKMTGLCEKHTDCKIHGK